MSALITGVGDANFSGRYLVGETEKAAVRTGVGAEAFLSQKIDGHKSADKEKRNSDEDGRESFPKIAGDEMVCPVRNERLVRRLGEKSNDARVDEHIQRDDERHEDEQPRAKRLRLES